ncbi:MAG TPA: hypothetical protein VFJ21_09500 [Mycobacteriales bacterium]|nr:hypothetical protein [Mycobacteriales bacterium]
MDTLTDYGFTWGPIEVSRIFEHKGQRVLQVVTDHRRVEVYVSPQGRSVRVYIDGEEVGT